MLLLGACATNSDLLPVAGTVNLPMIPGAARLQIGDSPISALHMPASEQLKTGNILLFSPIEFRSQKDHFNYEAAALPIGRYIAVRHSGEGITADLSAQNAKTLDLHYDARFPDMASAKRDFPGLKPSQFRHVSDKGRDSIEITQWQIRLSMIFSRERNAFRVLLDNLEYYAPAPMPTTQDETEPSKPATSLPVIVSFAYQYPDNKRELLVQQNVFFEFTVRNQDQGFKSQPQISGWIPLPDDSQTRPYTLGVVVAEVYEKREEFYKKLFKLVKNVRGYI